MKKKIIIGLRDRDDKSIGVTKEKRMFFLFHFLRGVLYAVTESQWPEEPILSALSLDVTSKQLEILEDRLPAKWYAIEYVRIEGNLP